MFLDCVVHSLGQPGAVQLLFSQGHLCTWPEKADEDQNPINGATTAPPLQFACGMHWSHVVLVGSKKKLPAGQVRQLSGLDVTSPWMQGRMCRVRRAGAKAWIAGSGKLLY
jgi:hypothetical protein